MQTLPAGVEDLGRLAAECEFWAAQRGMSLRARHDLHKRAQAYRDEQFRLLDKPYPHADVLEEGPNKSVTPSEDRRSAFWGIRHALIGEFFIGLICVLGYIIWRTYAH